MDDDPKKLRFTMRGILWGVMRVAKGPRPSEDTWEISLTLPSAEDEGLGMQNVAFPVGLTDAAQAGRYLGKVVTITVEGDDDAR